MIRLFVGTLCAVLLTGCMDPMVDEAPGPSGSIPSAAASSAQIAVPRDRAAVYFYRSGQLAGSANSYTVSLNATPVVEMSVMSSHIAYVAPGPITLAAQTTPTIMNIGLGLAIQNKPQVRTRAVPGGVIYIRVGANVMNGGPTIAVVDAQTAQAEMAQMQMRSARPL